MTPMWLVIEAYTLMNEGLRMLVGPPAITNQIHISPLTNSSQPCMDYTMHWTFHTPETTLGCLHQEFYVGI